MILAITAVLRGMSMFWSDKILLVYGRMPSHSVFSESNYNAKLTSFLLTRKVGQKKANTHIHVATCKPTRPTHTQYTKNYL